LKTEFGRRSTRRFLAKIANGCKDDGPLSLPSHARQRRQVVSVAVASSAYNNDLQGPETLEELPSKKKLIL
jgi:hypothetical protein